MTINDKKICNSEEDICEIFLDTAIEELIKLKMNIEKYRIESYYGWPIPYINIRELAYSGFFYTGIADVVKCNFCGVELYRWSATDIPSKEHIRWSPKCEFVKELSLDIVG